MIIVKVSANSKNKKYVLCNTTFFPACQCNAEGAVNNACADGEGQCTCKPNITGDKCDKCAPGFFGFPNCQGIIIYPLL